MINRNKVYAEFRDEQADKLFELLVSQGLGEKDTLEAVVHALVDISESTEKIYGELIPNLLNSSKSDIDGLKDHLWRIREEFRHIDYHLKDAGLTEL